MDSLIKRSPVDDAVYTFMAKKRAEGKSYYVYMTAGANKFLRIYYGRVREYLATLPENEETQFIFHLRIRPAPCGGLVLAPSIQLV